MPATDRFLNPTTSHSYRLVITGSSWRITKSVLGGPDESARLAHLRGTTGTASTPASVIATLLRGEHARTALADPHATFAAVVLADLDRTADVLTALTREAQDHCTEGVPGFRPGCAALRVRVQRALEHLTQQMQAMATAWRASQLVATPLNGRAGRKILELGNAEPATRSDNMVQSIVTAPGTSATERQSLVTARIGQGKFRDDVLSQWSGKCPVTQVSTQCLIRASHIKPWSDSNNAERLDPYNELPLFASYDAAFDAGLITFDRLGHILISPRFDGNEARRSGIDSSASISGLTAQNVGYLEYHEREVFVK